MLLPQVKWMPLWECPMKPTETCSVRLSHIRRRLDRQEEEHNKKWVKICLPLLNSLMHFFTVVLLAAVVVVTLAWKLLLYPVFTLRLTRALSFVDDLSIVVGYC
jgi:hypothetical protein